MTDAATADPPAPASARAALPALLHRAAGWSLFFCVVAIALVAGLILRRWAWDQTEPIRYVLDIDNAFRQGTEALKTGYVDRYDEQMTRRDHQSYMDLDYAPGRLAVATIWTSWVRRQVDLPEESDEKYTAWPEQFYGRARRLHRQYELCRPMLMLNLTGEILSAIAMFFLVRRYTAGKPPHDRPRLGNVLGLIAALFFWFDPALICNAHCWPQWDSWVLPFFLWAVLLASVDWWFCAGLVIATGAMFKGQILFGAPIFLFWPLFQGRVPAGLRWIVGLLTAIAAITAVWLVRTPGTNPTGEEYLPGSVNKHALEWAIHLTLIFWAMPVLLWWLGRRSVWIERYTNKTRYVKVAIALLIMVVLLVPIHSLASDWLKTVIFATAAMGLLLALSPRGVIPYAGAAWIATALLLCIPVFGASQGWFDLGFAYGTHHYEGMAHGHIDNLPELLQQQWGWNDLMAPLITLPAGQITDSVAKFLSTIDPGVHLKPGREINLPLKYFLVCVWLAAMILCSIGAARHDRNRSPRFLIALAAPWIVFFSVMTQMHQRYLLWGASLSAASAALSPGYALLHLFLSTVSVTQELQSMMNNSFDRSNYGQYTHNAFYDFVESWHPGIAWAVLLTAAIFVYSAIRSDPAETKKKNSAPRT